METIVGIDVSKNRLDVAVLPQGEAFAVGNDHAGIDELIGRLKTIGADAIALEATGGFETLAVAGLSSAGSTVLVVNPAQVRAYAHAIGRSAETDPIDAAVIAAFVPATKPEIDGGDLLYGGKQQCAKHRSGPTPCAADHACSISPNFSATRMDSKLTLCSSIDVFRALDIVFHGSGGSSMLRNRKAALVIWLRPVYINFGGGTLEAIDGPAEALEYMSERWPVESGQYFKLAKLGCVGALEGYQPAARARQTFVEAAREAGVLFLA
ncbi:hypothetical protein FHX06_005975 [Rhizobium sp. BK512]|uniref:IS110 family transposase n=1 Tax=Rhizobium sp. BK512 TaxID=2587010 RepID=UPI00160DC54C|nr:transposase [Rhizobium sp. BK512]MBB3564611.1 hypothetical protein [Rhizobium sp. BK512]